MTRIRKLAIINYNQKKKRKKKGNECLLFCFRFETDFWFVLNF